MAPHDKPHGSSFSIFYERITEHLLNLASHSEIVAIDFLPYYIYSIYFVKKHLSFTDFGHIVLSTLHIYKLMRSASQQFTKVCPIITLFYRRTSVLLRFRGDEPLTRPAEEPGSSNQHLTVCLISWARLEGPLGKR